MICQVLFFHLIGKPIIVDFLIRKICFPIDTVNVMFLVTDAMMTIKNVSLPYLENALKRVVFLVDQIVAILTLRETFHLPNPECFKIRLT